MMKKMLSLFMSFVLLLLSTNATYGAHYCGGEIVKQSVLLGKQHLSCSSMGTIDKCDNDQHDKLVIKRKSCCENKYASVDAANDYQNNVRVTVPELQFFPAHYEWAQEANTLFNSRTTLNALYIPPLIVRDFQVLLEIFRI